jgi:hypothetical protein
LALKLNRASNSNTVTIAASGTTSTVFTLDGYAVGGIILPSQFTGTTMTFLVCDTYGGTYVALEDAGGATISYTVEAAKAYALPPELFAFPYAKLVSGSSEGAERTIVVTVRG